MSGDAAPFVLRVDGMEILAEESGGRLVLSYVLADDESMLPALASYAAGRMMREDAVLAHGPVGGRAAESAAGRAFLWQDAPADADERALLRLFETFADSCDWWRDRVEALRGGGEAAAAPAPEGMMIRP
jgi:hypothetical protein